MFLRYLFVVLLGIGPFYLLYLFFSPITIYSSYFLLNLFFDAHLDNDIISFGGSSIKLIGACIGGAGYYLLLFLNFSIPNVKPFKRIKMVFFSLFLFFVFNILRIVFLSYLLYIGSSFFYKAHLFFWYFLSTFFVVTIWMFELKFFKIKTIPVYDDIKFLIEKLR